MSDLPLVSGHMRDLGSLTLLIIAPPIRYSIINLMPEAGEGAQAGIFPETISEQHLKHIETISSNNCTFKKFVAK